MSTFRRRTTLAGTLDLIADKFVVEGVTCGSDSVLTGAAAIFDCELRTVEDPSTF